MATTEDEPKVNVSKRSKKEKKGKGRGEKVKVDKDPIQEFVSKAMVNARWGHV